MRKVISELPLPASIDCFPPLLVIRRRMRLILVAKRVYRTQGVNRLGRV